MLKANYRWPIVVFLMELRNLFAYRADFWVNFVGRTFFTLSIAYFLWQSIFTATGKEEISGLNMSYMIFYYLVAPMIFRIQQGQNIGFLSREIYDGGLNKYLLYPLNVKTYKLMTYLSHALFYLLQLLLILILYKLFFFDESIYTFSLVNSILFIFIIAINSISFYYLFSITELSAFWFDNIWSLGVILRFSCSFLGGGFIPLALFPKWSYELLQLTPFPYMIDFPFKVLQGEIGAQLFFKNLIVTIVWLLVFRALAYFVWKRGKYAYTGVGI